MGEPFDAKRFLATAPEAPGVYRMFDAAGQVLYVGKAKNLKKRLASYFRADLPSPRIAQMVARIAAIEFSVVRSEAEALILENHLIKTLQPKYNILFRDDKSYPYLRISSGPFPGIYYYRGPLKAGERYFGPYPNAVSARESIQWIQKIFQLRTCEETVFAHRTRPCLLHQIRRCTAPCVGRVSAEEYSEQVRAAVQFLSGKSSELIAELTDAMQAASDAWAFERAAQLRDRIRQLQQLREAQAIDSRRDEQVDIFVAVIEQGVAAVAWGAVRGGHHLGDRTFFLETNGADEAAPPEDLLAAFIERHYTDQPLPERIIVSPADPEWLLWMRETLAAATGGQTVAVVAAKSEIERAWVAMALENARVALAARQADARRQGAAAERLWHELAGWVLLERPPEWIEAFDVSHHAGEAAMASCVVWRDGTMQPKHYRRFALRGITPGDDYAAIAQAVHRRYARLLADGASLPDLILIDGGIGQVRAAAEALADLGVGSDRLVGVAKGPERRAGEERLVRADGAERTLPATSAALHLIQQIRDEAHRFALTGSRARRAPARSRTRLEEIPGIGPKRRRALLAAFGSLEGVRSAPFDALLRVPGIDRKIATILYNALHGEAAPHKEGQ
ncbi:excinuclease ABC subunit UvrC [Hydrogenophilus islandicus]